MSRLEICGNIASGKTTLAKLMLNSGRHAVLENFAANPFFEAFYKDPFLNCFEAEVTFHLQHYHSIKICSASLNNKIVCDFSMTLDKAFADVNLKEKRHSLFTQISEELETEIGPPVKLIRLYCPEEVLLERIIERNREPEKSITLDYLKTLTTAIDTRIDALASTQSNIQIININSHQYDFASDPKSQKAILNLILNA